MPDGTPGGKRKGAGRPTHRELEQRRRDQVASQVQKLATDALPLAMQSMIDILKDPDSSAAAKLKAAEMVLAHGVGKPATKATQQEDGVIHFTALVPRPGRGQEGEGDAEALEKDEAPRDPKAQ